MKTLTRFVATLILLSPTPGIASGLPPWRFGMSKSEVVSFKEFAPYKEFKNGDVETFKGKFHGKRENIQFYFEGGRLRRIGVYLWEGQDPDKGIPVWRRAYELLQKDYGRVAMPNLKAGPGSEPLNADVLAIAAAAHAHITGKTEMLPVKQPGDMRVFARFVAYPAREGKSYAIAIYLDPKA